MSPVNHPLAHPDDWAVGTQVTLVGCAECGVGTVERVADGQLLVVFPTRRTWVDPHRVERV